MFSFQYENIKLDRKQIFQWYLFFNMKTYPGDRII